MASHRSGMAANQSGSSATLPKDIAEMRVYAVQRSNGGTDDGLTDTRLPQGFAQIGDRRMAGWESVEA